jgi:hypothetical protein
MRVLLHSSRPPGRAVVLLLAPDCRAPGSWLWLATLGAALLIPGRAPAEADVLASLRPEHPRLFARDEDWARLRKACKSDPLVRAWHEQLRKVARKVLDEPPVRHQLKGPRLLDQSRAALRRISLLAGLYRLDGDPRYAARARKEMLTAAAFPDWNPSHFLDTAEMTAALAIGYDWLFASLSPADRATVRQAIVDRGLKPGLAVYRKEKGWHRVSHNWNQVCNGGMTVGALAIADEEPALAREILKQARKSIVLAMHSYAPDGGWAEGPGYWNYATAYNVYFLAALESALGTDFGLKKQPGFADTGLFRIHTTGPTGQVFNFADGRPRAGSAPHMFWLARTFARPVYARHERQLSGDRPAGIFSLLWAPPGDDPAQVDLPRDALFRGVHVACFRSAWNDPQAVYLGFKGGDNRANHSHLDLGTFVLDAEGQRWAVDLGGDDYNLPAYFGKLRWSYYRLRTEGQNTLTMDGQNQNPKAAAPLVAFHSDEGRAFAVADLSQAYAPAVTRALRGVALLERRRVLIQDEVSAARKISVVWTMHTGAETEVRGGRAVLRQGKATLEARILEPAGATFRVVPVSLVPPQKPAPGLKKLLVQVPDTQEVRIAVLLTPGGGGSAPTLEPLTRWLAAGQLEKRSPP